MADLRQSGAETAQKGEDWERVKTHVSHPHLCSRDPYRHPNSTEEEEEEGKLRPTSSADWHAPHEDDGDN